MMHFFLFSEPIFCTKVALWVIFLYALAPKNSPDKLMVYSWMISQDPLGMYYYKYMDVLDKMISNLIEALNSCRMYELRIKNIESIRDNRHIHGNIKHVLDGECMPNISEKKIILRDRCISSAERISNTKCISYIKHVIRFLS